MVNIDKLDVDALYRMHIAGLVRLYEIPEWVVWWGMKQRCSNPKHKDWKYYGGRGIKVCDKWWESFWAFMRDLGRRPTDGGYWSLNRTDNDGNYEPGNVKWDTAYEQAWNQRNPGRKGVRHNVKLDWETVREIRSLRGMAGQGAVANDFGINPGHVGQIWRNEIWIEEEADLTPYDHYKDRIGENNGMAALSDTQAAEVKWLALSSGYSHVVIANMYEISLSTVQNIKHGRTYRHVEPKEPPKKAYASWRRM
jgi:hypothetical protein